jgi:hypothetical protein
MIWDKAIRYQYYIKPSGFPARYFRETIKVDEYAEVGDHLVMPRFLPVICYTPKATREEMVAIVIESSAFQVMTIKGTVCLQSFLQDARARLKLCRNLIIQCFERSIPGPVREVKLATKCSGPGVHRLPKPRARHNRV